MSGGEGFSKLKKPKKASSGMEGMDYGKM